jgi:hypothetical protein
LEKIVFTCLPLYRSITRCTVVSGASTSFWHDSWLPGACLAARFLALLSHCLWSNATVASVVGPGLALQPRLTSTAVVELATGHAIIDSTVLREGWDRRFINTPLSPTFSSREAYRALSPAHPIDASAEIAWASRLPAKVKIFSYLADIDRLSTRSNLHLKNCAPSAICVACPLVETGRHLFFDCGVATAVWARLGVVIPGGHFSIWCLRPPARCNFPVHVWRAGVAAVLWSLWKARNNLVFNGVPSVPRDILAKCARRLPSRDGGSQPQTAPC